MAAPDIFLVCYDICDEKRLRRVYQTMRGYGDRVQYSIFRCPLSALQLAQLKDVLTRIVAPSEDQVLILRLGPADSTRSWQVVTIGRPTVEFERVVRIL